MSEKDSGKSSVNFVNIPQELKSLCAFCLWKKEARNGKVAKVPYDPRTGDMAKTNVPETFSTFGTAMQKYTIGGYDGIGFRVSEGIGAIDIDSCLREDGSLNDVAATVLDIFKDSYFERSPSGTGLRGFFKLSPDFNYDKTVYYINNRKYGLEVYLSGTTNRFVTVTGDVYRPGEVLMDMDALKKVLDTFMRRSADEMESEPEDAPHSYLTDDEVIDHARRSKQGDKFKTLYKGDWMSNYESHSDADMALTNILAFWCGHVEEQIDRLFRQSGLMRPKWDEMRGDATYGQITIRKAIASGEVYHPYNSLEAARLEFDDVENEDNGPVLDFDIDLSRVDLNMAHWSPQTKPRYLDGEIGMGNLFADVFKSVARFNGDRQLWHVYDKRKWREDKGALAVSELAKLLANKLYSYALKLKDTKEGKQLLKDVKKLAFRRNRRTMIEDAKSVFPVSQANFDRNNDLFNCKNGTLNLKTLEFKEHDPDDFLTKISGVYYDAEATCPRWERFISEVMCGNTELATYLQKALGYTLTGDTSQECLFILYGPTARNGKGTTMETFLRLMQDYGIPSGPELLDLRNRRSDSSGPSTDIAQLAGVRFVNISEPEKSLRFNAALVKRMTGNDTLIARKLYENAFTFRPVFKMFINTNHLPGVSDLTLFDSGRLNIIRFNRHFNEEEQDKGLKAFFADEDNISGIFNWCLQGLRLYKEQGLVTPEIVLEATKEYQDDSDNIKQFIDAWLEEGTDEQGRPYEVRTITAYGVYSSWCAKYGYFKESPKNFKLSVSRTFPLRKKRPVEGGSATPMFFGCRLRNHENGEDTANEDFDVLKDDALCPF